MFFLVEMSCFILTFITNKTNGRSPNSPTKTIPWIQGSYGDGRLLQHHFSLNTCRKDSYICCTTTATTATLEQENAFLDFAVQLLAFMIEA
mmetsp:Transcript_27220/g.39876  ORF Transcript_27220/g.39876 Transcript_27220/m.39876 type:complete len:91 (-) Transcript_27220:40-312(-)